MTLAIKSLDLFERIYDYPYIDNVLDDNTFAALTAAVQEHHFVVILITCTFLIFVLHNKKMFMHLTRHRKGTINHENEHNDATIQAYYPPNNTI